MIDIDPIYTVAVSSGPILWAVQCDLCDDIVTESTTDDDLVDKWEEEHRDYHANRL